MVPYYAAVASVHDCCCWGLLVNHDGRCGTAPDPLVWDQVSRPKARKLAIRVNVDLASLPGPPGFVRALDAGSWGLHCWC